MSKYTVIDGMKIKDGVLIRYLKNESIVRIPDCVVTIRACAFARKDLKVLVIPDSVKSIGEFAFACCKKLKNITIPKNVRIGKLAFMDCRGLADDNGLVIVNNTIFDCLNKKLTEIEIRDVETVATGAFEGCYLLKKIKIHEGVKRIMPDGFSNCHYVTEIEVPDTIEPLKGACFNRAYRLEFFRCGNISLVPRNFRQQAILTFIADKVPQGTDSWNSYAQYLKNNCLTYKNIIIENIDLLNFMCDNGLIKASYVDTLIELVSNSGDVEKISTLLSYTAEEISDGDRERIKKSDEKLREKIIAKKIAKRSKEGLDGLVFVFASTYIDSRIKRCVTSRGGIIRSAVSGNTDYVVTGTNNSKSIMEKAQNLGIDTITGFDLEKKMFGDWHIESNKLVRYLGNETEVRIPENIEYVDSWAFTGRKDITKITVGRNVTYFDLSNFTSLTGLKDIVFENGETETDFFFSTRKFVVHAPKKSRIERYANNDGLTFKPIGKKQT